jgi:hypothetical protein
MDSGRREAEGAEKDKSANEGVEEAYMDGSIEEYRRGGNPV